MLLSRLVRFSIFILLAHISSSVLAQNGTLRGTVIDDEFGDVMIGANVVVEGAAAGGITDLDGKFDISVPAGTYKVRVSYVSYASTIVSDVIVKKGEVTSMGTIRLKEDNQQLGEVVVAAKVVRNTETAILTVKRKAPNLIDGISAATFEKIGDGDAAGAMSRVTGVSVEGGKYIFVRGLGDRYTKTTLNGVDIPGLDPDRNTIQMDLFPTNIIDNIVVAKSFTADLSADFTGGAVDIATKDFPDEKVSGFSLGLDYNPSMHFNPDFVKYDGSSTDFLGFDNGKRAIPTGGRTNIPQFANVVGNPNSAAGQDYQNILQGFDPTLSGYRTTSFMDYSFSYSYANQKNLKRSKKWKLGYNAALSYKNEREFYQDAEFNLYAKDNSATAYELIPLEQQSGDFGVHKVLAGVLGSVALKSQWSKIKLNVLHIQNGESKAGLFYFENTNLGANFEANQYNLEYNQRMLTNVLINGTHTFDQKRLKLDWKISPTRSALQDPDIRFTRFRLPNNTIGTEAGLPERIWRSLEEYNVASKVDLTKEYKFRAQGAKVLFGAAYTYKTRDFNIQNFQIIPGNTPLNGNPNDIFKDEHLFSADNRNGLRYAAMFIPLNPNEFNAQVHYAAAYVSNEANITQQLKAIIGLRIEHYQQYYTGTNQTGSIRLDNEKVISDLDLFPTLNLVYNLSTEQNLRASYTRTIARPSLKEMSYAEILDPITGRTFIGGMLSETTNGGTEVLWDGKLRSTNIDNVDLRWEWFRKNGDNLSLSGFFKHMKNPIEIIQFLADPGSFQPRNVGDARITGAEIEFRKSLDFIRPSWEKLAFNANFTYTASSILISETERRSRTNAAREGEVIADRRQMAGQAPWIVNAGLAYNNKEKAIEAGIFYNVQGPTLQFVGFGNRANVYSVPFHSLNFNAGKNFGKDNRMSFGIKVSNILNDWKEQVFVSYQASEQYFQRLRPGTAIGLKFGYKF